MKIIHARVKNFRLLKDVSLTLDSSTTLIVGRNNTGKTSLAEVFRSFISSNAPKIRYEDFNQSSLQEFETALNDFVAEEDEVSVRPLIPTIELELLLDYQDNADDYGVLSDFIVDLDDELYETKVLISYQLRDGMIKDFFHSLDTGNRRKYFSDLRDRISKYFEVAVYAIEPTNLENKVRVDLSALKRLVISGLINAQRGLDDESHSERDVLGKSLGKLFNSSNSVGAPEEFKAKSEEVNQVVEALQDTVDTDFQDKVKELLPKLAIFGYPGLGDNELTAATELNVKSLLESHTRVFYQGEDHFILPETYNGLGIRNLIFILFRIYEFFREFQSQSVPPKGHLIFIEEPEAHLHPQMQEVFIRQLEEIVSEFQDQLNDGKSWPVQFVVSTHSSNIANEADFSKVRYFLSKDNKQTKVKDLGEEFKGEEVKADKEFLHKYLTLTKCDLYFADRAILIEGATERILLPEMIRKVDKETNCGLRSKYMSVVEVGGAYAHHFYKFIDFLELKTLFITDLDSVNGAHNSSSIVSEGLKSSNVGLSGWYGIDGYADLGEILGKDEGLKVNGCRRIAFQVSDRDDSLCGRSFEDAFIMANPDLFELRDLSGVALEKEVFQQAKNVGASSKANFAIEYSVDKTEWVVPKYIAEGLEWLSEEAVVEELKQ